MVLETVEHEAVVNHNTEKIQRLAWIIVLVSFALFCSISIASIGSVYYFFFRSSSVMDVYLQVGRGSAGLVALDNTRYVLSGQSAIALTNLPANVTTDSQSQALLSIRVPQEENIFTLGTLTLEGGSEISLVNARRPRFEWSDGIYSVQFEEFSGEADIFIPAETIRNFEIEIYTADGATFLIPKAGRYIIISNETGHTLITVSGEAILLSPNRNNNRLAVAGQQVTLRRGGGTPIVQDAPINLIRNGLFAFDIPPDLNVAPQGWACFNRSESTPAGQYYADSWEGREALRLIRSNADRTSQTGCSQELNLNVHNYSFLELRATVALNYQSLQNCGREGSECPMMIFINFTDKAGNTNGVWYQGLFYNYDAQSPYLINCPSCGGPYEHRQISEKIWYTYETGNLLNRFTQEQQPAIIHNVTFYASGHNYDVFISEIALYAGNQVVPRNPDANNTNGN